MRSFGNTAAGIVSAAMIIFSQPPSLRADDRPDCLGRCYFLAQNPYGGTPEEQYQERQREYRERQSEEQHQKALRDIWQGSGSGDGAAYGAIAYSPESGDYGYSFSFSSRSGAERRAQRECGRADCEIAVWFRNSCGAIAVSDEGTWAGGRGNTEDAAGRDAKTDCVKYGGEECEVLHALCSR
jgi:serine/threonine-protein kinase